ncbi:MAG: prolipoprotein diacylglyceryl transferase [Anaerolineales bacterium]|nr:prolipoprotein diacylglyceryl transferase [Anaerolineales bacterium]
MAPILGRYGPFLLYGYTAALYVGILSGLLLTAWRVTRSPDKALATVWFDAFLLCLAMALIGGRVGFVIGEWGYFQERLPLAWRIWQGGLSYHGALLGGLLGLVLWAGVRKRPLWPLLDLFTPAFVLLHMFGWLACWYEGCAYGHETILHGSPWLDWLAASLPDQFGIFALRYQTQLLGGMGAVLVGLLLWRRGHHETPGITFLLALGLLSLTRLPLAVWRGDTVPLLAGVRLDMALDILLVLLSLLLLQYRILFRHDRLAEPDREMDEGV